MLEEIWSNTLYKTVCNAAIAGSFRAYQPIKGYDIMLIFLSLRKGQLSPAEVRVIIANRKVRGCLENIYFGLCHISGRKF